MQLRCIFDLINWQLKQYPQKVSVANWDQGVISSWSTSELQNAIIRYSNTFSSLKIQAGDTVVMVSRNSSKEELAIELALMKAGAIVCPLHTYYQPDEFKVIIEELNPVVIICQTAENLKLVTSIIELDSADTNFQRFFLHEDLLLGSPVVDSIEYPHIQPEDCAFIMYTSGSSGRPKGVMLSHNNILSNVLGLSECMPIKADDPVISYLPRSHVMERTATYSYIYAGANLHFVSSSLHLQESIQSVRPKWMTAVPLVLERLHAHVFAHVEKGKWYERLLFKWSKKSGIPRLLARILIVNAWKRKFGPGLRGVIVGGAALSEEIAQFFSSSGIRIREGYGLTETSPAITFNRYRKNQNRFGTVGIPIQYVDVRIQKSDESRQGEIEVKGPNVMLGYYNNQLATDEKLTKDGWLKTGDIGYFEEGKFLKITGRSSDIYKNASGRFVTPTPLERELESNPAILQAMVYGFNRPYNIALMIPDFVWLKNWAKEQGVHWTDDAYMIHNLKVQDLYNDILNEFGRKVKSHERIGNYILGKVPWTREDGLLSVTMKPRRKQILKEFEKQIKEVYQKPISR